MTILITGGHCTALLNTKNHDDQNIKIKKTKICRKRGYVG